MVDKAKKETVQQRLERMDRDHTVVLMQGKARIMSKEPLDTGEQGPDGRKRRLWVPAYSDMASMTAFYANEQIPIKIKDAKGNERIEQKDLFPYWLRRPSTLRAQGVTINSSQSRITEDGMLNLWQGMGIDGVKGKWPLMQRHIEDVMAAGDWDHASYIIRWCAWNVQNPTKTAEVALVFRGDKGTGKGFLLRTMVDFYGAHGLQISDRHSLTGNFNKHLQSCCLLFADEAVWGGDHQADGVLKALITEPMVNIEPKGIDKYRVPNHLSVMMASNEDWVVPATEGERRYAVFDVASEVDGLVIANNHEYFAKLQYELEHGGREAMFYELMHMDLKGWHPRQGVPETGALHAQQAESASPLVNWLGQILDEGALPFQLRGPDGEMVMIVDRHDPSKFRAGPMHDSFVKGAHKGSLMSPVKFAAFLDKMGAPKLKRTGRGIIRQFRPLSEARQWFSKKYPWWPEWSSHTEVWQHAEDVVARDGFDEDEEEQVEEPKI